VHFGGEDHFYFSFRSVDLEIWARHQASLVPANIQVGFLWDRLAKVGLPNKRIARLQELWDALGRVNFDRIGPNYSLPPLRVAHSLTLLPETSRAELVSVALCHNFRESANLPILKNALDLIEVEFLEPPARQFLDLLFINRSKERDENYLASYYKGIAMAGSPLVILKGFDKLDNHLTYAFENLDPFHHQTVKHFMIPVLKAANPNLAFYLERLVSHVEDPQVVRSYQQAAKGRGH